MKRAILLISTMFGLMFTFLSCKKNEKDQFRYMLMKGYSKSELITTLEGAYKELYKSDFIYTLVNIENDKNSIIKISTEYGCEIAFIFEKEKLIKYTLLKNENNRFNWIINIIGNIENSSNNVGSIGNDVFTKIVGSTIDNPIEVPVNILECDSLGWFYGHFGKTIKKSKDLINWQDVITINELNSNTSMLGFKLLANNELLILDAPIRDNSNLNNDKYGKWYVTTNGMMSYHLVHANGNRYLTNVMSWGIELAPGKILISEYGNSENTFSYDPKWKYGNKANAVKIWQSRDNGLTWDILVDLNNLKELFPGDGNLHIHGLHYDNNWNRLWVTTGDGAALKKSNRKLIWTDDFVNWKGIELTQYYWPQIIAEAGSPYDNLQGLSMYSNNDVLLIGSDCWRNGLFKVSKKDRDKIVLEDAYSSSTIKTDITHFTGRMKHFSNSPIFIPFARGDSATPIGKANRTAKLVATFDGTNFFEVWKDEESNIMGEFNFNIFQNNGNYYFTNKTSSGKMYIRKFSIETISSQPTIPSP